MTNKGRIIYTQSLTNVHKTRTNNIAQPFHFNGGTFYFCFTRYHSEAMPESHCLCTRFSPFPCLCFFFYYSFSGLYKLDNIYRSVFQLENVTYAAISPNMYAFHPFEYFASILSISVKVFCFSPINFFGVYNRKRSNKYVNRIKYSVQKTRWDAIWYARARAKREKNNDNNIVLTQMMIVNLAIHF